MNQTIEVIIEGLLAQKDKLEAVISELNSFEDEYSKDTKIINDRIDNLVLKDNEILDKFRQDLDDINKAITSLQSVYIDLSPYATLDNLKEALDKIVIPTAINGVDGVVDYGYVDLKINEYFVNQEEIRKNGIIELKKVLSKF